MNVWRDVLLIYGNSSCGLVFNKQLIAGVKSAFRRSISGGPGSQPTENCWCATIPIEIVNGAEALIVKLGYLIYSS